MGIGMDTAPQPHFGIRGVVSKNMSTISTCYPIVSVREEYGSSWRGGFGIAVFLWGSIPTCAQAAVIRRPDWSWKFTSKPLAHVAAKLVQAWQEGTAQGMMASPTASAPRKQDESGRVLGPSLLGHTLHFHTVAWRWLPRWAAVTAEGHYTETWMTGGKGLWQPPWRLKHSAQIYFSRKRMNYLINSKSSKLRPVRSSIYHGSLDLWQQETFYWLCVFTVENLRQMIYFHCLKSENGSHKISTKLNNVRAMRMFIVKTHRDLPGGNIVKPGKLGYSNPLLQISTALPHHSYLTDAIFSSRDREAYIAGFAFYLLTKYQLQITTLYKCTFK